MSGEGGGGVNKAQDNESYLKVTPLIMAIEGQNNESYREVILEASNIYIQKPAMQC